MIKRKKFSNNVMLIKIYIIQGSTGHGKSVMTACSQVQIMEMFLMVKQNDNFRLLLCQCSDNIFQPSLFTILKIALSLKSRHWAMLGQRQNLEMICNPSDYFIHVSKAGEDRKQLSMADTVGVSGRGGDSSHFLCKACIISAHNLVQGLRCVP